jgi:hypothetical protein
MTYAKYLNPDPRCTYPWSDCPACYCWAFANYVDANAKAAKVKPCAMCNEFRNGMGCPYYKPENKGKK